MKALQFVYTSCRQGMGSGSGFQTYSYSQGLTEEERRELERITVYIPPMNLPPQPTGAEIDASFPISMGYFQLQTGRFGVFQSRYTGRDFSGRFGNYLAHAFVLESGFFPFNPAYLWRSDLFWTQLNQTDDQSSDKPDLLPPLDVTQLAERLTLDDATVMAYIEEHHAQRLPKMVNAVIENQHNQRRLILGCEAEDASMLCAAIYLAFPPRCSAHLSFNTYTIDPAGTNALICGTSLDGGRFAFTNGQRDFEFYVFQGPDDSESDVAAAHSYVQAVEQSIELSLDNLLDVHNFFDTFQFDGLDPDIDSGYDLYLLRAIGVDELDEDRLIQALSFAERYGSSDALIEFAESLDSVLADLVHSVTESGAVTLGRFLFKTSLATSEDKHFQRACRFYLDVVHRSIFLETNGSAVAFNRSILETAREKPRQFIAQLIETTTLNRFQRDLKTSAQSVCIIQIFCDALESLGLGGTFLEQQKDLQTFFAACFRKAAANADDLLTCLNRISVFREVFPRLVQRIYKHTFTDQTSRFGSCLAQCLVENPGQVAPMRHYLEESDCLELLFAEYEYLLGKSSDAVAWFFDYQQTAFAKLPNFREAYYSQAATLCMQRLKAGEIVAWCTRILKNHQFLNADTLKVIFGELEKNLSFRSARDLESLSLPVDQLLKIKDQREVVTRPDVLSLLHFGQRFTSSGYRLPDLEDDKHLAEDLSLLPEDQYRVLMDWLMPAGLQMVKQPSDYQTLLRFISNGKRREVLEKHLIGFLMRVGKGNQNEVGAFVTFLEYVLAKGRYSEPYARFRPQIGEALVRVLWKLGQRRRDALEHAMRKNGLAGPERRAWNILLDEVDKKEANSISGRTKRFFKNVFSKSKE